MATVHYSVHPTGESSVSLELVRSGFRTRKHVVFFQDYHGEVEYNPEDIEHAKAKVVIDVASMICRDAWLKPSGREGVLETVKQLLNARECPHLVFESQTVQGISRHRAHVTGGLTMRGTTTPARFESTIVPIGKDQLEIDAAGTFRLSDYAIKPPSAWFGMPSLKDTVRFRMLLWPARNGSANPLQKAPRLVQTSGA